MEWIPESVLQKYVKDNMKKFSDYFDGEITHVEWRNDRYPDLVFVIDNKIRIPVEVDVKWSASGAPVPQRTIRLIDERTGEELDSTELPGTP